MGPVRGIDLPVVRDTAPRLSWNIAHTCSPVSVHKLTSNPGGRDLGSFLLLGFFGVYSLLKNKWPSLLCLLSNVCTIYYVVRKEKIAVRELLPLTVYLSAYRIKLRALIEGVDQWWTYLSQILCP